MKKRDMRIMDLGKGRGWEVFGTMVIAVVYVVMDPCNPHTIGTEDAGYSRAKQTALLCSTPKTYCCQPRGDTTPDELCR